MTTGRINQVSALPPTPAKSGTGARRAHPAQPSQKQQFCTRWLERILTKHQGPNGAHLAHLSAAYTLAKPSQDERAQTELTQHPDRFQRPARRLQTSLKRSYPASTNTQASAACADVALACNTIRPPQLHTRFGGRQSDGLR